MHPGNSQNKRSLLVPCHLISFYCLSLCFYLACLKKSTEKARVYRKTFIFKMVGVHSSLERSVMELSAKPGFLDIDTHVDCASQVMENFCGPSLSFMVYI